MDSNTLYVFWWTIAGALFFLELITHATIFIFPAIVALLIGFISLFIDNIVVQGITFVILSIGSIALIRPIFVTSQKDVGYKNGKDSLIGKKLRVVETINNSSEQGRIKNASDTFPARSIDDSIIEKGQLVHVVDIEGITVFVRLIVK